MTKSIQSLLYKDIKALEFYNTLKYVFFIGVPILVITGENKKLKKLESKICYFVRICSAPNPIEQDQEFLPKDVKCLNRGQILNKASVLPKASPSFGT
jgi:hypothetical protein